MESLKLRLGPTEIKPPEFLPAMLIARLNTEADAISLCWHRRRVKYSLRHAAELLGIPASHLSNIVNGKKYLRGDVRLAFQYLCGNFAIRQWEDRVIGARTTIITEEDRLRMENEELRAQLGRAA